jgi:hypothetical protein
MSSHVYLKSIILLIKLFNILAEELKNLGYEMNPNRTRLTIFIALPQVFIRVRYNEVSQQVPHVWGIPHSNHHKRD